MNKIMDFFKKVWNKVTDIWAKAKKFFAEVKWKNVWDKCTTGLLIFLMASPVLILVYIFVWFFVRQL